MQIGILSDSHDRLDSLKKAVEILKQHQVEMLIHCGDWVSPFTLEWFDYITSDYRVPVKSVFGNNEGDIKSIIERNEKLNNPIEFAPKIALELEIDHKKLAVFHGHDQIILNSLINSKHFDALFCGHTHSPRNEKIGNTLVVNPGSTAFARESRITNEASVAIYDSHSSKATIITFS